MGVVSIETIDRETVQDAWIGGQRTDNTKAAYRRDTDEFFAWCDTHGYDPLRIGRAELDRYRGWLTHHRRRGGPVAPSTLGRKLTALSSFYTYAVVDLEILGRSPMARVKRPERDDQTVTVAMDLAETRRFLAAAHETGLMPGALMHVMVCTGVRVSEACAARTTDLGMERGHRVLSVHRKGGRRQKLPLVADAWDSLDAYLGDRTGPLFLADRVPLYRQAVYCLVREVADRAGITHKRITPHSLRHTAATLALDGDPEQGVSPAGLRRVQTMLGHRDPRTTNRYDQTRYTIDNSAVHVLGSIVTRKP